MTGLDQFFTEMHQFRDVVNDGDLDLFQQLSSEAFVNGTGTTRPLGERYLRIYGVLQALTVQQDAIADCCNALGIHSLCNLQQVAGVRDVRIRAVGRPTLPGKLSSGHNHLISLFRSR
jgi:hypothetical protein